MTLVGRLSPRLERKTRAKGSCDGTGQNFTDLDDLFGLVLRQTKQVCGSIEQIGCLVIELALIRKIDSMGKHGECSLSQLTRQNIDFGPHPNRPIVNTDLASTKF